MVKVNTTTIINDFEAVVADDLPQLLGGFFSSVTVFGTILLAALIYWLFYVPCNWAKRLDDVGYDLALENQPKVSSTRKKDAINRMRRLRNIGVNELPPAYPNGWYGILESSELKPGQSTSVSCLGENFVVYRTLENKVNVLDAYCPHMGANLGVGGRVVGDNIECPFHLWSFQGSDGKCVNVPYSSNVPQGSKVRKWISRECHDFVFVWYHAENETPWELPAIKEIENEEFVYSGRNEFYVNCHIQEIPENGADLAHFAAIHTASMLAGGTNPLKSPLVNAGTHWWQAVWRPSESNAKHLAYVKLKHAVELTPRVRVFHMDVTGEQIGPSYVQLHLKSPVLGRIEILQTVVPVEPLVQKIVHRFYAPRIMAPIMKLVVIGESIMFERDVAMWNHKIYRSRPQLVKEDAAIKSFRIWYQQFYSQNSKTFGEAREKLQW